jgi:hypothetical protein
MICALGLPQISWRTRVAIIGDSYWLITTLLDRRCYPAGELIRLCQERWGIAATLLTSRQHVLTTRHCVRDSPAGWP